MPSTALEHQSFVRVPPTWGDEPPTPVHSGPDRNARIAIIVGAVLAALTVLAAAGVVIAGFALGLPMDKGIGERTPHPQTAADVAGGFALTAGDLEVDLRDVAFPRGTTRTKVEVGYGEATVIVPRGVDVVVDGHVKAGQVSAFGREDDGFGVDATQSQSAGRRAPTLVIDGHVGFGQLRVVRG